MKFRSRIFLIIFAVGLLPAIALLSISAYLLDSTLDKVGAAGLESSVQSAGSMVAESESMIGEIMNGFLDEDIPWNDDAKLNDWRARKRLDLVMKRSGDVNIWSISDSLKLDPDSDREILSRPGLRHLESEGQSILLVVEDDSVSAEGCGVIMPSGYAARGRQLSGAVAAAAGLGIYKDFSIQLLTAVTGACLLFLIYSIQNDQRAVGEAAGETDRRGEASRTGRIRLQGGTTREGRVRGAGRIV